MTKIKEGYKETEIGVIPEDWEVDTLNNLCIKMFVGIATSTTEYFADSGVPLIRNQNIKEGKLDSFDMKYITDEFAKANESKTLMSGDILTVRTGYPGISCVVPEEFEGSQTFTTLISRPKTNRINSYYLSYFINSGVGKKILESLKAGGAQQNLNVKSFETLNVAIPPFREQQRIAEILSTTDAHIEKLDKIIEDYQLLKKGMMKKLLMEGIGHTEFKETEIGRIPKEWEVLSLSEISENKGDYGISAKAVDYEKGKPRYLRITDIDDYGNLNNNIEYKSINETDYDSYILKKGDLVFARTGNTTGKTYLYKPDDGKLIFAGFLIKFTINSQRASAEFVRQCCSAKRYWDWVNQSSTRSGQPGINSKQYGELRVPIPPISEQNQIADILSSFDSKLEILNNNKEAFIQLKRALMDQLLAGKTRVNNLNV